MSLDVTACGFQITYKQKLQLTGRLVFFFFLAFSVNLFLLERKVCRLDEMMHGAEYISHCELKVKSNKFCSKCYFPA